jgi:hypothetical protein
LHGERGASALAAADPRAGGARQQGRGFGQKETAFGAPNERTPTDKDPNTFEPVAR